MSVDFTIYRGDTAAKQLTLQRDGSAVDLTGISTLTITGNTERNPSDATNQIFTATMTITDASAGQCEFELASDALDDYAPGNYYYDIQGTDSSSNIQTFVKSVFAIGQDITK